jgi:glycosyltransferase involved in cell wall biosynthesis
MNAKRVALYLPELDLGGVSRVMLNLAQGLAGLGLEVDLVLAKARGPLESRIPKGVSVIELRSSKTKFIWRWIIGKLTGLEYFALSVSSLGSFIRYFRQEQPRALLSGTGNVVAIAAWKVARVRTRLLVTAAVHQSTHFRKEFRGMKRLLPAWHDRILRLADGTVAESEGIAADLIRNGVLPAKKIHVIYNPVVTPEIMVAAKETVQEPWLQPEEPPVILAAGRLEEQKDYVTLIRAFACLREQRPARLIILGEGSQRSCLEAMVHKLHLEEDCRLPGFTINPFAYMARAAVFVLSSAWEGFGNVVAEALALGTPVVSTDCECGPREILKGGTYGRLVPVGDWRAMARAILETIDHPPPKEFLRQRGEDFSLEAALPKFLASMEMHETLSGHDAPVIQRDKLNA